MHLYAYCLISLRLLSDCSHKTSCPVTLQKHDIEIRIS